MNRKLFFISCLIVLLITVASASAADSNTTDSIGIGNHQDDNLCATKEVSGNTFADIQDAIDSAEIGDTLSLSGNYTGSGSRIVIYKSLTLEGNGAILDAQKSSGILEITANNVLINNITFINANVTSNGHMDLSSPATAQFCGGAIFSEANTTITNCNFRDCYAQYHGGCVELTEGSRMENCNFANSHAGCDGGALRGATAVNCNFNNCSCDRHGGAISRGTARNSIIRNCYASGDGGAISDGYAFTCKLINCSAGQDGGAMYGGNATDCIFSGNSQPETYRTKVITTNLKLTLKQSGTYCGEKKLTLKLVESISDKAIANKEVLIKFSNGKSATVKTNSNGAATYYIPFNAGTYSATASIVDKTLNCKSVKLTNIRLTKAPLTITPTKLTAGYASGKYFKIKAVNSKNKKAASGVQLSLKVFTGKKYKTVTATTNSKGIAQYSTSGLAIGVHRVIAGVKNTKAFSAKAKESSIKITKGSYAISAPSFKTPYKTGTFEITVKNKESGKAIGGINVNVKVYTDKSYKTYTIKTNKNGVAKLSTKAMAIGKHNVVISINGNTKYNAVSKKSLITISKDKIPTHFEVSGTWLKYDYAANGANKGATINIKLVDANGKVLTKTLKAQMKEMDDFQFKDYGEMVSGTSGQDIYVPSYYWNADRYIFVEFEGDATYAKCYEYIHI